MTHEEAEAEWERRDAIMNKFNFMNNIRLDDQIEGLEGSLEKEQTTKLSEFYLDFHDNVDTCF